MADSFAGTADAVSAQANRWVAVTPNDGADLAFVPKALWVNVAGNLALVDADGNDAIFAVAASIPIPLRARRVLATGTTATGIRAIR